MDLFNRKKERKPNTVTFITPTGNMEAYDKFVDKFKLKRTTDDCYTPEPVYDLVLDYVISAFKLEGAHIVRPFYPGGDYKNCEYPEGCLVVDNPPFSMLAEILGFYASRNINFFLFAPTLTLFSPKGAYTRLVCGADIIYDNGAKIPTSFISNMYKEEGIITLSGLYADIRQVQGMDKPKLPKYEYPDHLVTVSMLTKRVEQGLDISLDFDQIMHIGALDEQRAHKKTIFGGGYLISEKAKDHKMILAAEADALAPYVKWGISDREKDLINKLEAL